MSKKDKWKKFVNFSAVSMEETGTRSNIKSNYLDDKSRTKHRSRIEDLKNLINKWLSKI